MLIDSHCHLNMLDLAPYGGDLSELIKATHADGIDAMLCVGVSVPSSEEVVAIAQAHDNVYASVGVHPSDSVEEAADIATLLPLAQKDKVVAIGETGLDYYYNDSGHDVMQQSFRDHITLAKQVNKPLIIHTRAAHEDTIRIMREENAQQTGGVMHCFTESWQMAQEALELGFYVSISGIVTFKNAENVREVAKQVPLDRLLIETDAPYLAPVPKRGKKNEPKYVKYVAEYMADLRGIDYQELCNITSDNFKRLFLGE